MSKQIIFVYPLSEKLLTLKELVSKDESFSIYEIDDPAEYKQLLPIIGPSLTITSDLKKLLKLITDNRASYRKSKSRSLLLTKQRLAPDILNTLEKSGVSEILNESTSIKTLLLKITFLCKSLTPPPAVQNQKLSITSEHTQQNSIENTVVKKSDTEKKTDPFSKKEKLDSPEEGPDKDMKVVAPKILTHLQSKKSEVDSEEELDKHQAHKIDPTSTTIELKKKEMAQKEGSYEDESQKKKAMILEMAEELEIRKKKIEESEGSAEDKAQKKKALIQELKLRIENFKKKSSERADAETTPSQKTKTETETDAETEKKESPENSTNKEISTNDATEDLYSKKPKDSKANDFGDERLAKNIQQNELLNIQKKGKNAEAPILDHALDKHKKRGEVSIQLEKKSQNTNPLHVTEKPSQKHVVNLDSETTSPELTLEKQRDENLNQKSSLDSDNVVLELESKTSEENESEKKLKKQTDIPLPGKNQGKKDIDITSSLYERLPRELKNEGNGTDALDDKSTSTEELEPWKSRLTSTEQKFDSHRTPFVPSLGALEYLMRASKLMKEKAVKAEDILPFISDLLLLKTNSMVTFYDHHDQIFTMKYSSIAQCPEPEIYLGSTWENYESANTNRWKETTVPTWQDETFKAELNEFVFPFYSDARQIGMVVVHNWGQVKSLEHATFIELLVEATRGYFLSQHEYNNQVVLTTDKTVKKKTKNIASLVVSFFKKIFSRDK
jgi:hypothetical protein